MIKKAKISIEELKWDRDRDDGEKVRITKWCVRLRVSILGAVYYSQTDFYTGSNKRCACYIIMVSCIINKEVN